ncbi:MAG: hypothetical protein ACK5M7_11150 [Draconibacterium sp.]
MPFPSSDVSGIFLYFYNENNGFMNKNQLIDYLQKQLGTKVAVLKSNTETLTEARNNEEKSTVGDKYETGRAMVQMELEKSQAQLVQTENMKTALSKIDPNKKFTTVEFGSAVKTNQGNYFFSIAYGKVEIENEAVFCLSPVSPIGKTLAGKKPEKK